MVFLTATIVVNFSICSSIFTNDHCSEEQYHLCGKQMYTNVDYKQMIKTFP